MAATTNSNQIAKESEAVRLRREAAGVAQDAPVWGLALSGGGIRSATFCLGMIKALARNGILKRFDYVSTVSGGGYAGSALGRIFQSVGNPDKVQSELGKDDRLVWWWLRKNGRYLFPAGTKDTVFAVSTLLRGMLAVYFDLFMLGVLLGCVLVAPHIGLMFWLDDARYAWVSWAPSAWWLIALVLPTAFLTCMWAYWFSAPEKGLRVFWVALALAVPAAVFAWLMAPSGAALSGSMNPMCSPITRDTSVLDALTSHMACLTPTARLVLMQVAMSIPLAVIVAAISGYDGQVLATRNRLTRLLSACLTVAVVIVVAAVLDSISWKLATVFETKAALTTVPIFAFMLIFGRALLKWLKDSQVAGGSVNMVKVANVAGLLLAFLFLLLCALFVQLVVFFGMGFVHSPAAVLELRAWALQALTRVEWLALPCLLYVFLTGPNHDSLNKSSLHNFYRARLTRSYVSVGNPERGFIDPLGPATPGAVADVKRVSEVIPSDDIALSEYAPHLKGGPLHLINVCFNQTVDDRSGEFNRDRLGRNLTVSCVGADLGSTPASINLNFPPGREPTLGQWIAISGAAAAPGMGSNTSKGVAALLTLCGVRLGYWLDVASGNAPPKVTPATHLAKYDLLLSELTATFPKSDSPVWYLSDGGHFENTGIYALLKRRASLIVAADCGADPNYTFGDLNNLVRIARIDFNAEITFLRRSEDAMPFGCLKGFGTLREVASADSSSYMVLAKIQYAGQVKPGYLIILKPALIHSLPLDLLTYKSANPTFPQQPTADQFFDEAQWESYFRLGEVLGASITKDAVNDLLPTIGSTFQGQLGLGVSDEKEAKGKGARGEAPGREIARELVKSSLSIGAVGGLLITLWQLMDQAKQDSAAKLQRRADALGKAIEKSMDTGGGLRLGEGGILFLRTALDKEEIQGGQIDYSVAELLLRKLGARCDGTLPQEKACDDVDEVRRTYFGTQGSTEKAPIYWSNPPKPKVAPKEKPSDGKLAVATPSVTEVPKKLEVPGNVEIAKKEVSPKKVGAPKTATAKAEAPEADEPVQRPTGKSPFDAAMMAAQSACQRTPKIRIYPNVYTAVEARWIRMQRERDDLKPIFQLLDVRDTENVVDSARKNNTQAPYVWSKPTFVYHSPEDQGCAEALAALINVRSNLEAEASPLPQRYRPQPRTIEFWVPPAVSRQ